MTDPLRFDRPPGGADAPDRDRDTLIEEFLLTGLDHYFAEQYELAINVWTRVLFIDRNHASARAYIERARTAVAERQRKGDELLHTGSAAFDRGDAGAARQLVASAVEHGASADEALALMARIDRLETAAQPMSPARRSLPLADPPAASDAARRSARWKWTGAGVVAGVILGAAAFGLLLQPGVLRWPLLGGTEQVPVSTLNAPLPVTSIGEVALSRGQALYADGHLHDALAALDVVPSGDPHRRRADELTTLIQRQLLAAARSAVPARPEVPSRRP
ncbi:MAG TPA: hypothetical protein VJ813_20770 [Vicinamibacterales bacterium]|nr:hypothetical protein [Vicinamibacterales bacterium]